MKGILQHINEPWQAGTLHILGKGAENMISNEILGLGHLPPSNWCPGGAWRGRLLNTNVFRCPPVSPSAAAPAAAGGMGGWAWDRGSHLLEAWTSHTLSM